MEHIPLTRPNSALYLNQIKSDIKNLNLLDPFFYLDLHQTVLNHRYQPPKSHSIKECENKFLDPSLCLDSTPQVNGVYSEPRHILQPSLVEISSVVFV